MRTERGWGAHFAGAAKCYFRRNTLVEVGGRRVVVSTVGNYHGTWQEIGGSASAGDGRTYETMAFEAIQEGIYWEADLCKPVAFEGLQSLPKGSNDLEANNMHENAVEAIERQIGAASEPKQRLLADLKAFDQKLPELLDRYRLQYQGKIDLVDADVLFSHMEAGLMVPISRAALLAIIKALES